MTIAIEKPFNQKIRITALRLAFLAVVPVLGVVTSGWGHVPAKMMETLGILSIIAAVIGRFWAILYIGGRKNSTVLRDGPYSICRHPLYLFSTIGAVGFGLMLGSVVLTLAVGLVTFAILSMTAAREERFLRSTFGPQYDTYAREVPRLLPAISLFQTPARVSFDAGTLRRNAADALVFVGLIPLAELLNNLHLAHILPSVPLF